MFRLERSSGSHLFPSSAQNKILSDCSGPFYMKRFSSLCVNKLVAK